MRFCYLDEVIIVVQFADSMFLCFPFASIDAALAPAFPWSTNLLLFFAQKRQGIESEIAVAYGWPLLWRVIGILVLVRVIR